MNGFGLLIGHLLGDYILQNDWLAANKVRWGVPSTGIPGDSRFEVADRETNTGHLACSIHCLLYTLAIAACSFWWLPWWGYVVVFTAHWPIDRFRLARLWMIHISGQKAFATGPLSPWSIIIIDNVFHLVTLFVIGVIAQ